MCTTFVVIKCGTVVENIFYAATDTAVQQAIQCIEEKEPGFGPWSYTLTRCCDDAKTKST